jgi:hypothetical protein
MNCDPGATMGKTNARVLALALALALVLTLVLPSGCARPPVTSDPMPAASAGPALEPSPWSAPRLAAGAVPPIYLEVWLAAENRQRCALLAAERTEPAVGDGVSARAATFSGGWAVAYDLPTQRSAFGVAGTGASAWETGVYDDWPHRKTWADSSRVGYGPEDASGTNWLAYLRIPGQDCLYNVWSRRGRAHLEALVDRLRFVEAR